MAQKAGVHINKLNGGLGRTATSSDGVVALLTAIPTIEGTDFEKSYTFLQLEDAESVGFIESFDANHELLIHHHLSEIFRLAPEAKVVLIPLNSGSLVSDTNINTILEVLRSERDVKGLGSVGFTDTLENMPVVVEQIQNQVINELFKENRYIDFFYIEGKAKSSETITVTQLANLREKNAPNISVVIGQDPFVASQSSAYKNYAAIGCALGMLAVRKVNENLGSVNIVNKPRYAKGTRDYPLNSGDYWLSANLSDGSSANHLSRAELKLLTDRAYIFVTGFEGYGGFFFSNSPTCVAKASDYAFTENNRTWNKCARAIRYVLIPEVQGIVKRDPQTGFIKSTTISHWQSLCNNALERLVIADEISGFEVYIPRDQYLSEDDPLKVKAQVVKDDIVHEFDVDLGYTQTLN